jgi:hypothetical protein
MKKRLKRKRMFEPNSFYRSAKRYLSELIFDEKHNIEPFYRTYNQRKKAIYELKNKEVNKC